MPFKLKIFLLLLFTLSRVYAQDTAVLRILNEANKTYGANDLIERGFVYIPAHPKANGHPYYLNPDWNRASITLSNETFDGLFIKYNLETQEIILQKNTPGTNIKQPVILNSNQINRFVVNQQVFTNLMQFDTASALKGFGEVIYNGSFYFIRTYTKTFLNQYSKTNPYGLYSNQNAVFILYHHSSVYKISNKRTLVSAFPEIKKQLKKKLRESNFKFKKTNNQQWFKILSWCDTQLQ